MSDKSFILDKSDKGCCKNNVDRNLEGWTVEAIVSIDEKGQMVIPKDIREKANFSAGDKIAMISCKNEKDICCLLMVKADKLMGTISEIINR